MEAGLADTASPDRVVGTGTAESCTGNSVIDAVAAGGVITFDCGPEPVTIELDSPAKVFNDASGEIVIDGGGLVTLSGKHPAAVLSRPKIAFSVEPERSCRRAYEEAYSAYVKIYPATRGIGSNG